MEEKEDNYKALCMS